MSVFHNNALIGAGGGTAAAADGSGAIATKSLRFNRDDDAMLTRTLSSGNRRKWTWSAWIKRVQLGSQSFLFQGEHTTGHGSIIEFNSADQLDVYDYVSSYNYRVTTTRNLRDPSAWYHIVVAFDSAQSTAADRVKIYINGGSAETDFANSSYPSQNSEHYMNSAVRHIVGRATFNNSFGSNATSNVYLADVYFIDGLQLEPTSFGAYDSNGVWQAAAYSGTFGTNGFYLGFGDSSDLGADSSGNNNDFTPNNLTGHTVQTYPGVAFDGPTNGASVATAYLSIPASNSSDFNFGTGDFTWEAFILGYDWTGGSSNDDMQVIDHGPTAGGDNSGFFVDGGQSYYYSNKASSRNVITGPTLENGRWYHVAASRESGTLRLFVDGVSQGSASYTDDYADAIFTLGRNEDNNKNQFRGVISNFRVLKGTALYTSNFTVPTTPLTNITNTKLLCCQSSSSATTAAVSPGTIVANGDTNGTERSDSRGSNDSLFDVPTNDTTNTDSGAGGEVSANYATWNPLNSANILSNGNLTSKGAGGLNQCLSTIGMSSGKWYFEATIIDNTDNQGVGIALKPTPGTFIGNTSSGYLYYGNGTKRHSTTNTVVADSFTDGDVVGIAFDADAGNLYFYKNGVAQISGSAAFTGLTSGPYFFTVDQDHTSSEIDANFGQRKFAYDAPSGYKALCTTNLPTPTIADGSDYFDTKLYTGNGGSQSITGLEFSPDFVWIKNRATVSNQAHALFDVIRGNQMLSSSSTGDEANWNGSNNLPYRGYVNSFDSNGFSLVSNSSRNAYVNYNNITYVAWNWDAGSSTVSNTDGSITSSVRANQSAGFSIVSFTASSTAGSDSCGHGLNTAPGLVIMKARGATDDWYVWHQDFSNLQRNYLLLNSTAAVALSSNDSWGAGMTSSVIGFRSQGTAQGSMIAYCFAPVAGYSVFGSYTGTGSATNSPFVHLGFRARFILFKNTAGTENWRIMDTARNTFNVVDNILYPNLSNAEGSSAVGLDILSNGFKIRESGSELNDSGDEIIYAAFAENPFQANGGLAR